MLAKVSCLRKNGAAMAGQPGWGAGCRASSCALARRVCATAPTASCTPHSSSLTSGVLPAASGPLPGWSPCTVARARGLARPTGEAPPPQRSTLEPQLLDPPLLVELLHAVVEGVLRQLGQVCLVSGGAGAPHRHGANRACVILVRASPRGGSRGPPCARIAARLIPREGGRDSEHRKEHAGRAQTPARTDSLLDISAASGVRFVATRKPSSHDGFLLCDASQIPHSPAESNEPKR